MLTHCNTDIIVYLHNINVKYLHLLTLLELDVTEDVVKLREDNLLEMCTADVQSDHVLLNGFHNFLFLPATYQPFTGQKYIME